MYGHSARVWAARLLSKNIISIGEDATCIVWNYEGKILHKFKGHKGRSIWSLAVNKEETMIATGGGDSSIRLWYLDSESHNELAAVEGIHLQHYVQTHNGFDKNDFARTVMLTNNAEVITMTNAGYLLGYQLKTKLWRIITHDARFRSYGITSLSPSHHLVALGNIHGDIKIVHLSSPKYVQLSNAFESKVLGLCWADDQKLVSSGPEGRLILWNVCMTENELTAAKSMMFFLPESRQRWITTAAVLPYGRGILCGDKRGSLHHFPYPVDSNTEPIQPVTTLRGVHGKVGVTDICCHNNNVYSTGRDGTYKEYQFHDNFLQVMNTNKVYKGFEWIEKILIKENGEMQVLGFHTTHFVVWSVSQNQTLFQVDCGGGHRTWGYAELENISCFAFIKARDVFLCKQTGLQKQLILKDSLHGRELTCAKFLERINVKGIGYLLMATGSEDTMVKIVAVDCKTSKAVVIKTLQDHISSVRDLAICESHYSHGIKKHECQNKREEAEKLLFSVGGRCSIKCWRLVIKDNAENLESACTVSLLASYGTLDAKQRRKRMRQRQPLDPDTRYMALQVTSAQDVDKSLPHYNQFLTIAASDGFIRLFNFSEVHKTFINIWSSSWHNVCLLSLTQIIHKLPEGNAVVVCSAGTDGRVALWDITNLIYTYHSGVDKCQRSNEDKFYSEDSCSSKDDISCKGLESNFNLHKLTKDELMNPESSEHAERHLEKAMSAGSSSSVQIKEDVDITGASGIEENHKPLFTKRIHQSGINTMDIVNTGSDYLLASGGDDNAIHVTILKVRIQENGHIKFDVGDSFSIPSAHATLISGVKFLDKHNLLSSSIDQRLNSWKINHNKMKLIGSEFTHVADTSGLNVTIIGEKVYILLHGQGFQLLSTSSKVDE
ncbi:tRNA (34-2'-O)-methyltransferase regulator WDR6-like isoform X2 [Antedon mediterranea]